MGKGSLVCVCIVLVLSIYIFEFSKTIYGQSQNLTTSSFKTTSDNVNEIVSFSASITLQVSNETLKPREGVLKSAVVTFLNSGPNVFKANDQAIVKTEIVNQINNATQSVQGTEATNAIIGVEITKALKTLITFENQSSQNPMITVEASSTCKPSAEELLSCENAIGIK
jgi:hypothetical protein